MEMNGLLKEALQIVFGKKFYNYIVDNPDLGIKFINMGKYGRRAVYKIVKKGERKI